MPTPTLAEKIAKWGAALDFASLPAPVVHEVKRRIIDSIGCAYGAWNADPCTIARRVATRFSAIPGSTIFGTTHRAPPDWAAFANGCHVRYLDFNDTYLSKEPAHPSDNITAALAVAESQNRTGRELITAIAMAYELQCRLCDAASIRSRGWDHVTYGAFSTALAAAKLLRCPEEKIRHALGIAGVNSPNLRQSRAGELSHWKGCAFANAARHGVYSAILASEGITGPAPIFEGVFGFEKLVSGPLKLAGPIEDGSSDFMIVKTHIKFWPAEYHSQSAIEAALELRKQIKSVEEIESITIESHDASVDIIGSSPEQWKPPSRETADHSLPYITAVALADGEITDHQFAPERFTNPDLLKLVAKVKVLRNAELSAKYPREAGNIVTLRTTTGKTLTHRADVPLGNALKPLTDDQVLAKYHSQADEIVGKDSASQVADWIWNLETQKNVADHFTVP